MSSTDLMLEDLFFRVLKALNLLIVDSKAIVEDCTLSNSKAQSTLPFVESQGLVIGYLRYLPEVTLSFSRPEGPIGCNRRDGSE